LCALALIAVGLRYLMLRDQRRHTERTVATLTHEATGALALLRGVQATRNAADQRNVLSQAELDGVRAAAAALHADLSRTRADTTAAAVGAFTSAAQANQLRTCLTGVSQALNQLAVGDGSALTSLQAVEQPCRAVGIQ
jgi:hypothetical protein